LSEAQFGSAFSSDVVKGHASEFGPVTFRFRLDETGDVGKVEPDFDAAIVGTLGANGGGDVGAEIARRSHVFGDLRVDFSELCQFIHRGLKNLFLCVEAGAHGPFVEEVEEGAGFDEADGLGVG